MCALRGARRESVPSTALAPGGVELLAGGDRGRGARDARGRRLASDGRERRLPRSGAARAADLRFSALAGAIILPVIRIETETATGEPRGVRGGSRAAHRRPSRLLRAQACARTAGVDGGLALRVPAPHRSAPQPARGARSDEDHIGRSVGIATEGRVSRSDLDAVSRDFAIVIEEVGWRARGGKRLRPASEVPRGLFCAAMQTVRIEARAPHVKTILLDRPERLNAISFELVSDLHDALDAVAADDDCKVAVLTGAGRGFCAGLDLRSWGSLPAPGGHPHFPAGRTGQAFMSNLTQHIRATPQIVIGAVNGAAFGGGFSLALACDLRVATTSASFCSAFIKTGLTGTDIGVTYLLPRLIGAARAFDLILTGRTVGAEEAERMGIVSRVIPDAEFAAEVTALANTIAGYTQYGLRNTKEVMWHNLDTNNMAAAIALENRNQDIGSHTQEVRDYMARYAARHQKQ